MDKKKFMENLIALLKESLGDGVTITCERIEKSNNLSYEGLVIEEKAEWISPVIRIENCYEDYVSGISLPEIAKKIVSEYKKKLRDIPFLNVKELVDYEKIKDRLYLQVVNREWNKEYLEHKYYVPFLDLAIVFYVDMQIEYKDNTKHQGISVTEEFFKAWGISADTIWEQALENLKKESLYQLISIMDNGDSLLTFCDAYDRNQGALVLIQAEVLSKTKEKLKEPFYILPASLYDVMIVPESQADTVDEMKMMLTKSNDDLPEEYMLSNNIYYYGEEGNVKIVG